MTGLIVDRREVYRYMGCQGEPDGQLKALVEECLEELEAAAVPRQVSLRAPLQLLPGGVMLGELEVRSESLAKHLQGCTAVILFAATLGAGVDRLLRRCAVTGMGKAVAMQAASAAMIEAFCDRCQNELEKGAEGLFLRPRFSPGYGDLPLDIQKPLLSLLQSDRRIGLSVTDSMMMAPSKSVSAIIGLTPDKKSCSVHKCAACPNVNCPFRKEAANGK